MLHKINRYLICYLSSVAKKKHSKIHLSTKQTIFIDFNIHFCFQNTMLTTGTEQKSLGSDLHNFKELLNKVKEIMDGKTKL